MNELKKQIEEYLKKTQYYKTKKRISEKEKPCRNDGGSFFICEIVFVKIVFFQPVSYKYIKSRQYFVLIPMALD